MEEYKNIILFLCYLIALVTIIVKALNSHKNGTITIFYSYTDFGICILTSLYTLFLIFILSQFQPEQEYIKLIFLPYLLASLFLLFTAYRSNHRKIFKTLRVFFIQILLFLGMTFFGVIAAFIAIAIISLLSPGKRQKYERKAKHKSKETAAKITGAAVGITSYTLVIGKLKDYICRNNNFSLPPKYLIQEN
ncbi:hypothetical protein [Avibacterium sp. 20-129]|uniref:hypothetical protein n=1 Tax=Avibacterium sp. 20-129 TaxID=2911525 RepID=UPI0022459924|nr:hypothetical protein [Avibacterium sp. 20-129]MCW9698801.1 hypothetical protein [Avibacterium sp. 20-129]